MSGVRLFVGGHAWQVQGEVDTLGGDRMLSASVALPPAVLRAPMTALLDSGAFSDPPHKRLSAAAALERQLAFEHRYARKIGHDGWQAAALVSYDLLIDETWIAGARQKRRWSVAAAERAVQTTVDAAAYLAARRRELAPRALILSCQGVDALQYAACAAGVLRHAQPRDWLGLGGWCILGRQTTLLPVFWQTTRLVLPMALVAGVRHIHIFGVLYLPALGGLLWLADQYGLTVSTDSTAPILACTRGNAKKAGVRALYWRDNVAWWQQTLANLRSTAHYRAPPDIAPSRQETLL